MTPSKLWLAKAPPVASGQPGDHGVEAAAHAAPLKVLIVEDEFFIALDAQAQVEALGHAVVGVAVSAEQAVAMTAREKPDVVLMDIRLSGARDGIDAALEIRKHHGVECIFVTANTDPATLLRAEAIKPIAVLQKPLTQTRLGEQLAQVRDRSGNQ
jgi:CheY-like chemotaxis protein